MSKKIEVKKILKEKGKLDLFTDARFKQVKAVMKYGMKQDDWLKNFLGLDPLNKSQWCADHLIRLVEAGYL